jgi:hypothetical protein
VLKETKKVYLKYKKRKNKGFFFISISILVPKIVWIDIIEIYFSACFNYRTPGATGVLIQIPYPQASIGKKLIAKCRVCRS